MRITLVLGLELSANDTGGNKVTTLSDIRTDQRNTRRRARYRKAHRHSCEHLPLGCGAPANKDTKLCFWHDPKRHDERMTASHKGGEVQQGPEVSSPPALAHVSTQLKACSRCRGDLCYAYDQYGEDVYCIQCGYRSVAAGTGALAIERQGDMKPRGRTGRRPQSVV